ncbi:pyrimidine 5'-nucleotidase [Fodinicurvata sp. EGI_FJ10296]|uniref:pyrimidine 5'-nucleotidase n=1 Tax=Fodinicurvata sp. EGI_FJ10296 TaxID=3231908 RepID=UPI00345416C6
MSDRVDHIETWVFDLDNTLYPASSNLFDQVDRRMGEFIAARFAMAPDEARLLQKKLFREHGTTLRGLMTDHGVAAADFLDFVHDIDLSVLAPQDDLVTALEALPGRKLIFTNGSERHAERVLGHIGIDHLFDGVMDIVGSDYVPKPAAAPYDALIARFAIEPARAAMVEDMARNLEVPHRLGMTTVWVAGGPDWAQPDDTAHIHHVVHDLAGWLSERARGRIT